MAQIERVKSDKEAAVQELGQLSDLASPVLLKIVEAFVYSTKAHGTFGDGALAPGSRYIQGVDGCHVHVAFDREESLLVLAFQGPATAWQKYIGSDVWQQRKSPRFLAGIASGVEIHSGFLDLCESLLHAGKGYKSLDAALKDVTGGQVPRRVITTGYCMGGSLATIAATWAAVQLPSADVRCITFGAPLCGNSAFADMFRWLVGVSYRCVYGRDPVPNKKALIGALTPVHGAIYLSDEGMQACEAPWFLSHDKGHHSLTFYSAALLHAVQQALTNEAKLANMTQGDVTVSSPRKETATTATPAASQKPSTIDPSKELSQAPEQPDAHATDIPFEQQCDSELTALYPLLLEAHEAAGAMPVCGSLLNDPDFIAKHTGPHDNILQRVSDRLKHPSPHPQAGSNAGAGAPSQPIVPAAASQPEHPASGASLTSEDVTVVMPPSEDRTDIPQTETIEASAAAAAVDALENSQQPSSEPEAPWDEAAANEARAQQIIDDVADHTDTTLGAAAARASKPWLNKAFSLLDREDIKVNVTDMDTLQRVLVVGKISQALVCAMAAYKDEEAFREITGVQNTFMIDDKGKTDTQVHVAWLEPSTAVFAFRGTASVQDGLQDAKFMRKNIDYLQTMFPGTKAHTGFMQQFAAVVNPDKEGMHLGVVLRRLSGGRTPTRVLCTGHSLGGALATLGAAWAALEYPQADIRCITFGSPRVGNNKFKRAFHTLVGTSLRLVHGADPVPMIPPSTYGLRYHHVSGCIHMTKSDVKLSGRPWHIKFRPNVADHYLKRYGSLFTLLPEDQSLEGMIFDGEPLKKVRAKVEDVCNRHSTLGRFFVTRTVETEEDAEGQKGPAHSKENVKPPSGANFFKRISQGLGIKHRPPPAMNGNVSGVTTVVSSPA